MLIYSVNNEARFRYAVSSVLSQYIGVIEYTSDLEYYQKYDAAKIKYGYSKTDTYPENEIPHTPEIWKNDLQPIYPEVSNWHDIPALYFAKESRFDIFAATFYMLSRYEEYLKFEPDAHGRFKSSSSILYKNKNYRYPLVDKWRNKFQQILLEIFPELKFTTPMFSTEMTIDVDSAYAYKHKGFLRTCGGIIKDLMGFKLQNLAQRLRVLSGTEHDPYNTYDYIQRSENVNRTKLIWFFLLSDYSKENINVPHTSVALRALICSLHTKYDVGIHPGYQRQYDINILQKEIQRLFEITGTPIDKSRQHYLKMTLPNTYQNLHRLGITDDYTMGYADDAGFRAGTSMPFIWFDLLSNTTTSLTIHPFVIMDTTLNKYLELSTEESIALIDELRAEVMNVNGIFSLLWHNESLSEKGIWKGWRKVWENALNLPDAKQ